MTVNKNYIFSDCPEHTYGYDCQNCSNTCIDSECDKFSITMNCSNGCIAGYTGMNCSTGKLIQSGLMLQSSIFQILLNILFYIFSYYYTPRLLVTDM